MTMNVVSAAVAAARWIKKCLAVKIVCGDTMERKEFISDDQLASQIINLMALSHIP